MPGTPDLRPGAGWRLHRLRLCHVCDNGVASYGVIEELVVTAAYRGRGIGRELLNRCTEWLLQEGADLAFVSVLGESAESFYQACGFKLCTGPWLYWTPHRPDDART